MHAHPGRPLSLLLLCLAAVRRNDRDARAHDHLGRLAMLDDDADAAAAQLARAAALDRTAADYHLWYGSALSRQAGRASKLGRLFIAKSVR